ncbi:MAG: hypothetical protein MI743_22230 [Sneathiellales bacterium]|nr:hypothetical protein [Sneathiellales bacterium]
MKKFLSLLLFLGGIALAGWEFHGYATSGDEIENKNLSGAEGQMQTVHLSSEMSPVRLILSVDYKIYLRDQINDAYRYDVRLISPSGVTVVQEKNTHSVKKEDRGNGYDTGDLNHILGAFQVREEGVYTLNWLVRKQQAEIRKIGFSLRNNVRALHWPTMALAGGIFLLGLITVFAGRK